MKEKNLLKGGEYIIRATQPADVFTSKDLSEEQTMMREATRDFIETEILSRIEEVDSKNNALQRELSDKIGALGMYKVHMPESLGGLGLDFNTSTVIGEEIGVSTGSFSVTFNAHTGIGMLPILYFGTEEQKKKYLPDLMDGKKVASYCLTEPSSGSDALAAKTQAVLSEDGSHYVLNGQKMWISNAGFADVFVVFAQVDGDKFSTFILDKEMEGLTLGEEEHKLGITGSSTRMVFLENVKVPVENLLGEVGKGHLIAFNALNTGRFKLGASCLGGCKAIIEESVKYANERHQFKQPISNFGAIKYKLAEMAIGTFALDSIVYRTSGLINDWAHKLMDEGETVEQAKLKSAKEYALESSILKVVGSEVLDYCADEGVQIFGGMGYSSESSVNRAYRDSRINRIFEGTNEINRLVIFNTLVRSAMKGRLDLVSPALAVQKELKEGSETNYSFEGPYAEHYESLENNKKLILMMVGSAMKYQMDQKINLKHEQEIMMNLADMMSAVYCMESMLLKVDKIRLSGKNVEKLSLYENILKVYFFDNNINLYKFALDSIGSFIESEQQANYVTAARKYTKSSLCNVKELRRNIADDVIANGAYGF